jgi:hypothetical protein
MQSSMFGFKPKLPLSDEDRQWVDNGFSRLSRILGRNRMLQAKLVLPDAEHFPDHYDKSESAAEKMFLRICDYMQVDPSQIELEVFPDEIRELRTLLPYWRGSKEGGCAGLYVHPDDESSKMVVAIRHSQLDDPLALVATIAHELGHVILLGGGRMDHSTKDMEPMTDLLTVFLGFGIFNANCSARLLKWQNERKQGWSMKRLGYLPEEIFGYALARFAQERGERRPRWTAHLSTNVRSYFNKSAAWLESNEKISSQPIG